MTGKNPHFIPTHHFELCQGNGGNLLVNSHSNCFINPSDEVIVKLESLNCQIGTSNVNLHLKAAFPVSMSLKTF